jgi:hypothetical protein
VEHFAPGEAVGVVPGICFMAPDGNVVGYQYARTTTANGAENYRCGDNNRWVLIETSEGSGLHDRTTGREFAFPTPPLGVRLMSADYVVFSRAEESRGQIWPHDPSGPYFVVDDAMNPVSEFPLPELGARSQLRRWKRGPGTAAIVGDELAVQVVDLATGKVTVLFEPEDERGYRPQVDRTHWQPGQQPVVHYHYIARNWEATDPPWFSRVVVLTADAMAVDYVRDFAGWNPDISPDGRFVAYDTYLHDGPIEEVGAFIDRWPATYIADARTNEPILRVRSMAHVTGDFVDSNRWLADSSGVVGAYRGDSAAEGFSPGFEHAILSPEGQMTQLPIPENPGEDWFRNPSRLAPVPSPWDTDLFSYGRVTLYDSSTGKFVNAPMPEDGPGHLAAWGTAPAEEMRFIFPHFHHGIGGPAGLLPAKVEYPPFDDSLVVRVTGAGTCLNLRAAPAMAAEVVDCLVDGTELLLEPEPNGGEGREPGVATTGVIGHSNWQDGQSYVRVVTGNGRAGWVAIQFLEWA